MFSGSDTYCTHCPKPTPKKSVTGTSTLGVGSSSHQQRTMSCRWMATLLRGAIVDERQGVARREPAKVGVLALRVRARVVRDAGRPRQRQRVEHAAAAA